MSDKVRILIADDHSVVREGVRLLLKPQAGWEVCAAVDNGRAALDEAIRLRPDVIVLDLQMPELSALEVVRQLKCELPEIEFVVFTGHTAEHLVQQLFDAGVKSVIHKKDAGELLVAAIRSVAQRKPFFTPDVSELLFARLVEERSRGSRDKCRLSRREREIIRHIADGKSNKETAAALGISTRTAETHRAAVMRKLRLSSTAGIVRYAIRNSIIEA